MRTLCITEVKSPRQKMTHFKVYKVQPPPESKLLLLPEEKPGTSHALSRPLQNLESTSCLYGFTRSGHLVETELYSVWPFVHSLFCSLTLSFYMVFSKFFHGVYQYFFPFYG